MSVSDDIRKAVEARLRKGVTRYAIARDAEVDYRSIALWLDEDRDIRLSTIDALADYLGMELRPKKR